MKSARPIQRPFKAIPLVSTTTAATVLGRGDKPGLRSNAPLHGTGIINMSFKNTLSAVMAAATLATGILLPLASASARDFDRRGPSYAADWDRGGGRNYDRRDYGRYQDRGYGRRDDFRHKRRNNNGKYVAIGAAAAIIGLAIASQAGRSHGYRHDYRD